MSSDAEPPICLPCWLGDCDSCPRKLQQRGLPAIGHWRRCRCDKDGHPRRNGSRFGQDHRAGLDGGNVRIMARKNVALVYDPDPRYYVTLERDRVRRWYRLWFLNIVERETQWDDTDELVAAMAELRLDANQLREPTEEEKQPRRET